ncbi:hypothetical protein UFOVP1623_42 [uncultured Caudovirales phage]|uniref:Uncharacterized protein n=1 Tax=uncultured Caudovirales phage TaxID=2100421 RepID=A0A6J5SYW5_9CAUD|nr:hypothetical protein UFOVP1376_21 [uncultured Caudovirales phage]CAB4220812.1 hypothetical protein UFOVP1623_42 [uncultured Caudovirales phage]
MTTFAHTETGQAIDPREAEDKDAYYKVSNPDVRDKWTIERVPDGTAPGSTPDGNGGWTAPSKPPPPPPPPAATTKQQILDQITVLQGLANQL